MSAPGAGYFTLPAAIGPRELEQHHSPSAGAVLAQQEGRAGNEERLHGLRLHVPDLRGGQAAGQLALQQGLPPHRLLPQPWLHHPYLQAKRSFLPKS